MWAYEVIKIKNSTNKTLFGTFKESGIYLIMCNGRPYVGKSKNIEARIKQHAAPSSTKTSIDRAMKKYPYTWAVLERVPPAQLNKREKYWIDVKQSYYLGYNWTIGGDESYASSKRKCGDKKWFPPREI